MTEPYAPISIDVQNSRRGRVLQVAGTTTTTAGLAVIEDLDIPRHYRVTHIDSGLGIGGAWRLPENAQTFAARLGDLGIDWTRTARDIADEHGGDAHRVMELYQQLHKELHDHIDWAVVEGGR